MPSVPQAVTIRPGTILSVNEATAMRALTNGRSLSNVWLAVPSLPEQHAIAEALSDVNTLLESLEKLIAKKAGIKQAAIRHILTGRVRQVSLRGGDDHAP